MTKIGSWSSECHQPELNKILMTQNNIWRWSIWPHSWYKNNLSINIKKTPLEENHMAIQWAHAKNGPREEEEPPTWTIYMDWVSNKYPLNEEKLEEKYYEKIAQKEHKITMKE